ncbi:MSMEG_0568 family radical SAM protein [Paenibacillus oralis]|uniref:MSMEG_0568 family radical SAM protein n=1 Tax=Paenibacillus oralis TaxID=2490856 RepID=A0A3P3UA89_9BACL|nr:MSMEG_0568 family radical SAM protein [Paenibacillus oralis]RRJ67282.1 MSMEG_0568 family radical SAM protein [Paenibacillus oralis]
MKERDIGPSSDESLILVDIQNRGIRIGQGIASGRRGGAGPTDDAAFRLGDQTMMLPVFNGPAESSPYSLVDGVDGYKLQYEGKTLMYLNPVDRPQFYDLYTADGIPYNKIAVLHSSDVLASTVIQSCIRWGPEDRCKFCAIGHSLAAGATLAKKLPEQLAEVVMAAERLDGIRQITLTTGTPNETDRGAHHLAECVRAIRKVSSLPIQVQCEPPEDDSWYDILKEAGANTIGLHVESFDEQVRRRMMPSKSRISLDTYFEAFGKAVAVFGRNQVTTYVILGMGEDEEVTIAGCARAVSLGVYPFVVPLRPLRGTLLEHSQPPSSDYMEKAYRKVAEMLSDTGLSSADSMAGCAKCGACSALASFERRKAPGVATR